MVRDAVCLGTDYIEAEENPEELKSIPGSSKNREKQEGEWWGERTQVQA